MTQQVTVLSVNGSMAKVAHKRPTACHGDCEKCAGGCGSTAAAETLIVDAENLIGAAPGDRVVIEGEGRKVAWAMFLVYVLPLVLFLLGYFLVPAAPILASVIGFFLGIGLAVLAARRQKQKGTQIRYRIVSFAA